MIFLEKIISSDCQQRLFDISYFTFEGLGNVHFKSPTHQDLKRLHRQAHAQWMQVQKPENRKIDLGGDTPTKGFKRVDSRRFSKVAAEQKTGMFERKCCKIHDMCKYDLAPRDIISLP